MAWCLITHRDNFTFWSFDDLRWNEVLSGELHSSTAVGSCYITRRHGKGSLNRGSTIILAPFPDEVDEGKKTNFHVIQDREAHSTQSEASSEPGHLNIIGLLSHGPILSMWYRSFFSPSSVLLLSVSVGHFKPCSLLHGATDLFTSLKCEEIYAKWKIKTSLSKLFTVQ
jgi:hypothetical protein